MERTPAEEPQEFASALRFVFALTLGDQLRVHEALSGYLAAARLAPRSNRKLEERKAALGAMRAVCEKLGLPDGTAPTVKQFSETARELDLSMTVATVTAAWGRWRFAQAALLGERAPESAAQKGIRRASTGVKRTREDYLTAVRMWLATEPASERAADYAAWTQECNAELEAGAFPVPQPGSIRRGLRLTWSDVLGVARREISLDEAPKRTPKRRHRPSRGPHDLVAIMEVVELLGRSRGQILNAAVRPDFPCCVARFGKTRMWLREDIEAYRDGRTVPKREENELRALYLKKDEVAELVGLNPGSILDPYCAAPDSVGMTGGVHYWLQSEVEEWLVVNPRRGSRRRRPSA